MQVTELKYLSTKMKAEMNKTRTLKKKLYKYTTNYYNGNKYKLKQNRNIKNE